MELRKITADKIFNGYQFLPDPHVLITGANGRIMDLLPAENAGEGVEYFPGILCPGFINTHCHVELSHLKDQVPPGTGLVNFLLQVVKKRTQPSRRDSVSLEAEKQIAMTEAEDEMYKGGIVAVGDICNTPDSISLKKNSRLHWHNFIEVLNLTDSHAPEAIAQYNSVLEQFKKALPHQHSTLSPHAPYTLSPLTATLINEQTPGAILSIHNQETAAEDILFLTGKGDFLKLYEFFNLPQSPLPVSGKSSLASWLPYFTNRQQILLVHNSYTSAADLELAVQHSRQHQLKLFHVLCINANLYIEDRLPPLAEMINSGCAITLGTDSYSSNYQLSIWEEIKTIQQHFPQIPLHTILNWATLQGAKALNMEKDLGSFEKDKQPGIVLIDSMMEKAERLF